MEARLRKIASMLRQAQDVWAFTGAGVSTDSGIPDFRSPGSGLWDQVDPMEVGSIEGFLQNTARFYEFWHWRFEILSEAEPNATHRWLARLETDGRLQGVVTQNIDGLHRRAGSDTVYELHGSYQTGSCVTCQRRYDIEAVFERAQADGVPRCDACTGLLKPNVVLFGEMLPDDFYEALTAIQRCDLLFVLGTSLEVFPAAEIVPQVTRAGGRVVVLNAEATPMDHLADVVLHGQLKDLVGALEPLL